MAIDVSIPSERNTSVKVTEKLSMYKDLEIEIIRMWETKTEKRPVVIGALGLVKKGLDNIIDRIPGRLLCALPILVQRTYGLMSHPKEHSKYLAQGHKCQDRDSNPHSADQKHQSLSPVLLTTRPGHAIYCS